MSARRDLPDSSAVESDVDPLAVLALDPARLIHRYPDAATLQHARAIGLKLTGLCGYRKVPSPGARPSWPTCPVCAELAEIVQRARSAWGWSP